MSLLSLAIETSCDETSVAVIKNKREIVSNIIYSQIDIHKKFGGVVPEVASRNHLEKISQIVDEALNEAECSLDDLDYISVTNGPGLVGALLVGLSYAKALSFSLDIPLVPVNHIEGHIYANFIEHKELEPPFISLVVSGGHTHLVEVKDYSVFNVIGRTRDDAAGESFDKVARKLGLGYPGGPIIDELAKKGNPKAIKFPRSKIDNFDFSFSGLKTAVLNYINMMQQRNEKINEEDVAASFQAAVVEVLVENAKKVCKNMKMDKIVLAGGVAANNGLREALDSMGKEEGISIYYPSKILCTDNAAMIGCAGAYRYERKMFGSEETIAIPNLEIDS
ncbi:tRNA (adenosine(37)-N6)-threonylcarbamoyltransferase complex transferase subunit TsaD [Clostridiaceae bacterium HSG29]|nr:tRNA (adenosine(37)-N6)-threonylcarbamoyltransferase complex transferase subunit TsaD [Clostridiaceae bacterium HSG29]